MPHPPSSLAAAARAVAAREVSPVELTRRCLDRIDADNGDVCAFITVLAEEALAQAARAEDEIARGRYRGPLHGIPVSIKDLIDLAGTPTTGGSAVPAPKARHDARVVMNLRAAGAVIIGKTNLHEFAFGTTSDETAFGAVRHPHDRARSAGGSSGGAAVSVAAGMCFGAVGTDTGGSIRIPAAACGLTGLKPTYGEVSTDEVLPLSTTCDHVGPIAATVEDTALLFLAMRDAEVRGSVSAASGALWFGIPRPYFFDVLDDDVRRLFERAVAALTEQGHTFSDTAVAHAERTADAYLHIVLPEASWYHAPILAAHAGAYAPGVRLRLEMGRYVLAEDYQRGLHARGMLRRAVDRALEGLDALLLPSMPIGAPLLGTASATLGGAQHPLRAIMLRLTQLFNITGHPAVAIPCGTGTDGLPRSLQIVGHRGATDRLLEIAAAVEPLVAGESA